MTKSPGKYISVRIYGKKFPVGMIDIYFHS